MPGMNCISLKSLKVLAVFNFFVLFTFLHKDWTFNRKDDNATIIFRHVGQRNVLEAKGNSGEYKGVGNITPSIYDNTNVEGDRVNLKTSDSDYDTYLNQGIQHSRKSNPQEITTLSPANDLTFIASGTDDSISDEGTLFKTLKDVAKNFIYEDVSFTTYALNASLSQSLPLIREVPESRLTGCISRKMSSKSYPAASIIIPFHNEQYSLLLRGLHSVLSKTPSNLIHEIILIDDNSTLPNLKTPLEEYIQHLPRVRLFRTKKREGLIRARLLGAKLAKAEIIVFLDAHIECQINWLEPLIEVILSDNVTIAIPAIDSISPETLNYKNTDHLLRTDSRGVHGTFDWALNYAWIIDHFTDVKRSPWKPVPTATTIGCAMAMKKDFFFHIGAFDEDMHIWGGENLEISFRTWMCGGSMKIVPCSKIGHVFRQRLPYKFPNTDQVQKNLQRVAEVWMDDYKHFFYRVTGPKLLISSSEQASLEARITLRKNLQCKSFQWFMDTLNITIPMPLFHDLYFGQLMSASHRSCFTFLDGELGFYDCMYKAYQQQFHLTSKGQMIHEGQCVTYNNNSKRIVMQDCQDSNIYQKWHFLALGVSDRTSQNQPFSKSGRIKLAGNHQYCMSVEQDYISPNGDPHFAPCIKSCLQYSKDMIWSFTHRMYHTHVR